MIPDELRDFFVAAAGVGGALVGLLFVAISVSAERLSKGDNAPVHRIQAAAALTAFTNALAVSLFALTTGGEMAWASVAMAVVGLAFTIASLLSLARMRLLWSKRMRDLVFLGGLIVIFGYQLLRGVQLDRHPGDNHIADSIAILVVACFLLGVARSWELIGGPSFGITTEVTAIFRKPTDPNTED